jgi:trk system potassium uptake protein TrkA
MKIIILGAGQVGSSVAEHLAGEANDITVVDTRGSCLQDLQDHFDLRTVHGSASHPDILRRAGAEDADMIIAVTNSDETNMVACQVAYTLFHTPTKIARVRSRAYLEYSQLFAQDALPIDVLISPEQVVIDYVQRLIEYPGALQVLDFAGGKVRLVAVKAYYGGPLVFFIAATEDIRTVMSELRKLDKPVKRVMLVGGGNIGTGLAKALENNYQVKLIEHNAARTRAISEELNNTLVLLGDAADGDLLIEENIENTDVFCSVTNDDEANILSAMLAKRLGAKKVMTLINRAAYAGLVESGEIDIAISPNQATIGSLLTHIRRGDVVVVHSLRRGAAEAMEAIAHGDVRSSKVVGRSVEKIKLPPGTTIGAIVRRDEVITAHHDTVIEPEDHVILFLVNKKQIMEVEKLFQVGVTFF